MSNKKLKKKVNFVFFVNSEKTRHYKINYTLFKTLSLLLIALSAIIGFLLIAGLNSLIKEKNLSEYVLNLKNFYIQNYFESHFNKDTQDEINEEIASISKKKEFTNVIPLPSIADLPAKIEVLETLKESNPHIPKPEINNYGIVVDKGKVDYADKKIVLSFLLLNSQKNKGKLISGAVCAVLAGIDSKGVKNILSYPINLELSSGIPNYSCIKGEHVKFNRLRPTTFSISTEAGAFKVKTAKIYFLEKNSSAPVIIKNFEFNS